MFIKKKLKYFTRPKQISPDLSGVSGDFRIVCFYKVTQTFRKTAVKVACVINHFIQKSLTHSFIEEKIWSVKCSLR